MRVLTAAMAFGAVTTLQAQQPRIVYKVANYPIEIVGSSQGRPQTEAEISADTKHGLWMTDSHGQADIQPMTASWLTTPPPSGVTNYCTLFFWANQTFARPWKLANCPDCYLAIWIPAANCRSSAIPGANGYMAIAQPHRCGGFTYVHELGHMLGFTESSMEHCTTVSWVKSCTTTEYGTDDVMGTSTNPYGFEPLSKCALGWAWCGVGAPIPGQIVYDIANTPGEHWIEEQTIRTNLFHKALIMQPRPGHQYSVSLDRGSVRIRTHQVMKDLDPVSPVSDYVLDVGQSYDIEAAVYGFPLVSWRVTNIGREGTGVRIRIEDLLEGSKPARPVGGRVMPS